MRGSIEVAQRRLLIWIALATLVMLAVVIVALERGGRPDPASLRAAATLLDGRWQFHTGDDPRWADAGLDDHDWETIDLTSEPGSHDGDVGLPDYVSGWMAHGHPDHTGYAWYRRAVAVPAAPASWDILGPTLVEEGYELYWNGQLLGGSGRLGSHPRVVGTRPLRFALPPDAVGTRGVLALRVYMRPGSGAGPEGGGVHSAPILAPRPISDGLHHAQWARTIAGYIVDAIEPLAMLGLIGLALWCRRRSDRRRFLAFAGVALALTAARRLNNAIVSWTDLMDLPTYSWLADFLWIPTSAAWMLAWNRWLERGWLVIDVAAFALAIAEILATVTDTADMTHLCRLASVAVFAVITARIVHRGPMRLLASVTLAVLTITLFGGELLDPLGVPGIWFPLGIGVSRTQYLYAIAIPLLAALFVRTSSDTRANVS